MVSEMFPKTDFDKLLEQMKTEGFNYCGIESLHLTSGKSGKDTDQGGFMFVTEQTETEESIMAKYKALPEFSDVQDRLEVKLVEQPYNKEIYSTPRSYYVFVKINEPGNTGQFQFKTKEELNKLSIDEAKDRLRVLENEFQRISEDPALEAGGEFYTARQPIDAERGKIFDKFPELEE